MVSIDKFKGIQNTSTMELVGLSLDEKPVVSYSNNKITNGSTFFEMDTSNTFLYDETHHQWLQIGKTYKFDTDSNKFMEDGA